MSGTIALTFCRLMEAVGLILVRLFGLVFSAEAKVAPVVLQFAMQTNRELVRTPALAAREPASPSMPSAFGPVWSPSRSPPWTAIGARRAVRETAPPALLAEGESAPAVHAK